VSLIGADDDELTVSPASTVNAEEPALRAQVGLRASAGGTRAVPDIRAHRDGAANPALADACAHVDNGSR
jgi:hypothetical protein